jgi:hypothetical protein
MTTTPMVEDDGARVTAAVRVRVELRPALFIVADAVPDFPDAIVTVVGLAEMVKFPVTLIVKVVSRIMPPPVALTVST